MKVRISIPSLRKAMAFVFSFTAASIVLHMIILPTRSAIFMKAGPKKQKKLIRERFNTSAVIPAEYLLNTANISRHDFESLIKPRSGQLCIDERSIREEQGREKGRTTQRLLILFLIHSKADHFEYRKAIRETWASVGKRLTQVVFLLGNPANQTLQRVINAEHERFGDLLQEDFLETYRNITLKNIMGLKWASQHCSHAKYVVKTDDDMFVNSKMLISTLINSNLPKKDLILCKIHFFKDVPREGKYLVDKSLYSADYWPSFCFGGCWVASMDVVHRLYEMSLQTKQIYLDDVYVTGILRTKLSLPINYISRAYMIFCHTRGNYTMVRGMWNDLEAGKNRQRLSQRRQEPYVKYWARCFT